MNKCLAVYGARRMCLTSTGPQCDQNSAHCARGHCLDPGAVFCWDPAKHREVTQPTQEVPTGADECTADEHRCDPDGFMIWKYSCSPDASGVKKFTKVSTPVSDCAEQLDKTEEEVECASTPCQEGDLKACCKEKKVEVKSCTIDVVTTSHEGWEVVLVKDYEVFEGRETDVDFFWVKGEYRAKDSVRVSYDDVCGGATS